jgi:2-iminobutanoate/2-iminopropanoate deaminase
MTRGGTKLAGRRTVINLPGMAHGAPIPMGAKVGNVVYSSGISGVNPETHAMPPEPDEQAMQLFENIRTFMEIAGGTTDDIVQMTVLMKDDKDRGSINKAWLKMFPDEDNRPARHALTTDVRAGGALFQIELVAVVG